MKIGFLINLLVSIKKNHGPDVDVIMEVHNLDGLGDSGSTYSMADVEGIQFSSDDQSITLTGENG